MVTFSAQSMLSSSIHGVAFQVGRPLRSLREQRARSALSSAIPAQRQTSDKARMNDFGDGRTGKLQTRCPNIGRNTPIMLQCSSEFSGACVEDLPLQNCFAPFFRPDPPLPPPGPLHLPPLEKEPPGFAPCICPLSSSPWNSDPVGV